MIQLQTMFQNNDNVNIYFCTEILIKHHDYQILRSILCTELPNLTSSRITNLEKEKLA